MASNKTITMDFAPDDTAINFGPSKSVDFIMIIRQRRAADWRPVVNFTGVYRDHVAGEGFHTTDPAPRSLRARQHDSDAVLIVGMARKASVGSGSEHFDAAHD